MSAFFSPIFRWTTILFAGLWSVLLLGPMARADEPDAVDGLFISVQNPITDAQIDRLQKDVNQAINLPGQRVKKIVFDFNPGESEAATANYGSCLTLARYIRQLQLNGFTTIAFVHAKTTRHSVLPVLACGDLVMSTDAKIGEVTAPNEVLPEEDAREYAKFAGKNREAVVSKMFDKNVEVVNGNEGQNWIYVDAAKVGKAGTPFENVTVSRDNLAKPVIPRGVVKLYDVAESLRFKICVDEPLNTREEVAKRYGLTAASLHGDRTRGDKIKAAKLELAGAIDGALEQKFKGQLKEVRAKKENTLFLVLECSGGNAKSAREIADEIRELKNDDKIPVWTVAFIPNKAPDLATFIAFACSEIVMYKGSDPAQEAVLGDFETFFNTAGKDPSNTPQFVRINLKEIAKQQGYPEVVVDGLLDKDETIHLVRDEKVASIHFLMTGREFAANQNNKERKLAIVKTIKQPGSLLKLNATLAKELRIAQTTVDNRDIKEVYAIYGRTEKEVRDSKPGWLDDFAAFLRRTEISILLVIIAFASLILEFKMPGATIPGVVSLICFMLFFWAHAYANGQTIYLAIALFVLGLILLAVEIFILPGFGISGIGGVMLILAGVGLATMEKAPSSSEEWTVFAQRLLQYGLTLVAAGFVSVVFARYLPKIPYANRLMLIPPNDKPDIDGEMSLLPGVELAAALLGQVGTATSMLRPAGMARFGDRYVDVVTEGGFIAPGTPIQVIEVEGTRIVVKKV